MSKKPLAIEDLNYLYSEGESCDKELFSEMRSNVLLVAGEHYTRRGSKFWDRIRDSNQLSEKQKLRLTKNHIQVIIKTYVNNIVTQAPGVTIMPHNDNEMQDQKVAEMNLAVWQDLKARNKVLKNTRDFIDDFFQLGEVACKVFFDPNKGQLIGHQAQMDEFGQPRMDEMGQMVADTEKPVMSGDFVFERIYGFNLIRAREAKTMEESRFLCFRKMAATKDLLSSFPEDDPRRKFIQDGGEDTYTVFDGSTGQYQNTKDQVMVREFYFRSCSDYPNGYFYITTNAGILYEGELPFGVFPIVVEACEEIKTSPRGRSPIKHFRPYQAEINRSASKIAETQVTLGDDKLIIQSGTKMAPGGQLPGIRAIQVTGAAPTIMPGRSGDQYLAYMQSQILEMYQVAMLEEDKLEKDGQLDPYAMLYRSLRQKKRFAVHGEKIESFLTELCETTLKLAKGYYNEYTLIPAVSRKEYVNIPEFKSSDPLQYQIKVEPQSDDIETKMGKQLTLNHILQYVGNSLGKDDIGRIMRSMPYANSEEAFGDLTLNYDIAKNCILALDRGEMPEIHPYDDSKYMMQRLGHRMAQPDFSILPPQVQQNYQQFMSMHEQKEAAEMQKIKAAESDFIPAGGFLVGCDFYVNTPGQEGKTRRARVPYQSLEWLIKRLEEQGMSLDSLEAMQQGVLAETAGHMQPQPRTPMPGAPGVNGPGQVQDMRRSYG